jgi:alkylation response protein AidB-like acyl-CoA dehydrogenase
VSVVKFPGSEPTSGPLSDPSLDPLARLGVALQQLARARTEWEDACSVADEIAGDGPDRRDELEQARIIVRAAYKRWSEIGKEAEQLAAQAHRAKPADDWQKVAEEKLRELQEQFDGGPHYDLLCERVAGLHVRLKQMEASGRDYPAAEYAYLNQQLLGYINQLQRYTEAMKTESISREAQGVAEKILQVVERNLATSHPELWRGVVRDVRQALESAA